MLVAKGLSNTEVGSELCVCKKTVGYHMTDAIKRLKRVSPEVTTRPRLIVFVNTLLAMPKDGEKLACGQV